MTHKEFYIWLDGFMTNRRWTTITQNDIETIQEKMKEVKEEVTKPLIQRYEQIPVPINPFPGTGDPTPPWTITCETKQQLND